MLLFLVLRLLIRRPLVLGQGRQACEDIWCSPPVPPSQWPKIRPVWSDPMDFDLSFLSFETLSSSKALPKPLRSRFWSDFGSKNGPKIEQKSIKNRCLYSTSFFDWFFMTFLTSKHSNPWNLKKLFCFFNISASSTLHKLCYIHIQFSSPLIIILGSKIIKTRSKNQSKSVLIFW